MYTSYFANMRNLPKEFIPVSISLITPTWYDGVVYNKVAPTKEILYNFKQGKINERQYRIEYLKQVLKNKNQYRVIGDVIQTCFEYGLKSVEVKNICFLCYEKPDVFCHRHIFASWLTEYNVVEYKQ